ncbi:unnamed protein product [Closterium sp. NIES-54]
MTDWRRPIPQSSVATPNQAPRPCTMEPPGTEPDCIPPSPVSPFGVEHITSPDSYYFRSRSFSSHASERIHTRDPAAAYASPNPFQLPTPPYHFDQLSSANNDGQYYAALPSAVPSAHQLRTFPPPHPPRAPADYPWGPVANHLPNHRAPRQLHDQSSEATLLQQALQHSLQQQHQQQHQHQQQQHQQQQQQQHQSFTSSGYTHQDTSNFHPSPHASTTPPLSTPPISPLSTALLPPASAPPRLLRARSPAPRPSDSSTSPLARPVPLNSRVWLAMELLCILALISAGVCVLALFPHEKPPVPLRLWILGYTLGCLLLLPLLYFRYTHRALRNGGDFLLWQQQQQEEEERRRRQWRLRETPSRPAMASSQPMSPLRLPRAAPAAVSAVDISSSLHSSLRPRSPEGLLFPAAQTVPNTPYLGARVSGGGGGAVGGWATPFRASVTGSAEPASAAGLVPEAARGFYPERSNEIAGGGGWPAASGVDMYSAIYYNGYDDDDDEDEVYGAGRYSGFRHIAAAIGERMLSCVRWIVDELQDDARVLALVERYKVTLDCFFAVWFVLGNVWVFGAHSAATTAPNLYILSVLFITLSCVSYAMPFLLCAAICCCLPCLLHLLGHPHHDDEHGAFPLARSSRGATTAAITTLPSFKYRRLPDGGGGRVVRLRGKRAPAAASAAAGKAVVPVGHLKSKMGGKRGTDMGGGSCEAGGEGGVVGGGSGAGQGRGGVGGGTGGWFGRLGGYLMRRTAGAAAAAGPPAAAAASGGGAAAAGNAAAGATGGACVARSGDRRKSASEEREKEGGSESEGDSDEEEESVVGLLWPGTDKQRPVRGGDAVSQFIKFSLNPPPIFPSAASAWVAIGMGWTFTLHPYSASSLPFPPTPAPPIPFHPQLCCICLGRYRDGVDLRELPCSHHFHQSCVDTWLKINSSCPLCKEDISRRPRLEADGEM